MCEYRKSIEKNFYKKRPPFNRRLLFNIMASACFPTFLTCLRGNIYIYIYIYIIMHANVLGDANLMREKKEPHLSKLQNLKIFNQCGVHK